MREEQAEFRLCPKIFHSDLYFAVKASISARSANSVMSPRESAEARFVALRPVRRRAPPQGSRTIQVSWDRKARGWTPKPIVTDRQPAARGCCI